MRFYLEIAIEGVDGRREHIGPGCLPRAAVPKVCTSWKDPKQDDLCAWPRPMNRLYDALHPAEPSHPEPNFGRLGSLRPFRGP